MYTFDRVAYSNETDLQDAMKALMHRWKTKGDNREGFHLYTSDFPKVKRYAVASCGTDAGTTGVVVAAFASAWATYWKRDRERNRLFSSIIN